MTGQRRKTSPPSMADAVPAASVGRQCARCGAVGTHFLTCPDLRLPMGYRVSEGSWGPRARGALNR